MAIASLMLVALAAMAVDVGLFLSERRGVQNAADAAVALRTIPYDHGLLALGESGSPIDGRGNTHVGVNEGGVMSNGDIDCRGSSKITAGTVVHSAACSTRADRSVIQKYLFVRY